MRRVITLASSAGTHYAVIFGVGLPALVSVLAAALATWEARRARQSEQQAEQLRRLEARVSAHRFEVYEPMITLLGRALRGIPLPANYEKTLDDFNSWLLVYGSDEAIEAWGHLMQATYENAPAMILVRLYAEFFVAARRDLGDEDTELGNLAVLAPRVNDLFKNQASYYAVTADRTELDNRRGWQPPWERSYEQMNDDWESATKPSVAAQAEAEPLTTASDTPTRPRTSSPLGSKNREGAGIADAVTCMACGAIVRECRTRTERYSRSPMTNWLPAMTRPQLTPQAEHNTAWTSCGDVSRHERTRC